MRFSLSACVVHSDQPETKATKMRQCSGANRIIHVKRQKSGNTAQIRGGIHWVQIIPPMYLTQFSLQKQYSLARCRQSQWLKEHGIIIQRVTLVPTDYQLTRIINTIDIIGFYKNFEFKKSYLDILSYGKSGLQNVQSAWGSSGRRCFDMKSFIQLLSTYSSSQDFAPGISCCWEDGV